MFDPAQITDAVTLIGGVFGILLALDKVVGRLRKKAVSIDGKRWGNLYYAYLIFNEPMALSSFTMDAFAGTNLLSKVFEKDQDRFFLKALDQITISIDLVEESNGSLEVELLHGTRATILGSAKINKSVFDSSMSYEYLNREVQINIGYIFKSSSGRLAHKVYTIKRKVLKHFH